MCDISSNSSQLTAKYKHRKVLKVYKKSDFEILLPTGSGAYGVVYDAIIIATGLGVVLKKCKGVKFNKGIPHFNDSILKEIIFTQFLNKHKDTKTITFYGVVVDTESEEFYIVLEKMEIDLYQLVISNVKSTSTSAHITTLSPHNYCAIFYQLLTAIKSIHSLGFIHNDIKLGNIMILGDEIRIIDFGLMDYFGIGPLYDNVYNYISTDVIKSHDKLRSFSSDLYSIGATIVHLCICKSIVLKITDGDVIDSNGKKYAEYLSHPDVLGPIGFDLLVKIMNKDYKKRLSCKEALLHPYFDDLNKMSKNIDCNQDIIKRNMLKIDRSTISIPYYIVDISPVSSSDNSKCKPTALKQKACSISTYMDSHSSYTIEEFKKSVFELKYMQEIYSKTSDIIIVGAQPQNEKITDNVQIGNIHLIKKFYKNTPIGTGIDTIVNALIYLNKHFEISKQKREISSVVKMFTYIFNFTNNSSMVDYKTDCHIFNYIIGNNCGNCRIEMYPIWTHIEYIYLKLKYTCSDVLKKYFCTDSSSEFVEKIKIFMTKCVIIWYSMTISIKLNITIQDVIIYSCIRSIHDIFFNKTLRRKKFETISIKPPLFGFLKLKHDIFQLIDTHFVGYANINIDHIRII